MSKYRYGLTSFVVDDINPADGTAAGTSPKELKEDVYRDTFDLIEEEGAETEHYNEMDSTPLVTFNEPGSETITLQVMDTRVDTLALLLGGTVVTGAGGEKTWSKPDVVSVIEKHVTIETQDGYKVVIPRAKFTARKNFQIRRNNIWLIDVTIKPLKPQFAGLAAIDVIEPAS